MKSVINGCRLLTACCAILLLTPRRVPAQAMAPDSLIEILQAARRSSGHKLRSFSIPYTLSIFRLKNGDLTSELERQEHFSYQFTYAQGKWAEKIDHVHMVGHGGESFDNSLHRTYDRLERRALFRMGLETGQEERPLGHIHADDTLHSSLNYTTLLDCHGTAPVVDYLMEHRENAEVIEMSDDSVKLLIREDATTGARTMVTFDPQKDFHVKEIEKYDEDGNRSLKTVDFQKVSDGVWLPKTGRLETFVRAGEGYALARRIVIDVPDFDRIEINQDYPDSVFTLTFEEGTRVTDFTAAGIAYTVGEVPLDLLDNLHVTYSEFTEDVGTEDAVSAAIPDGNQLAYDMTEPPVTNSPSDANPGEPPHHIPALPPAGRSRALPVATVVLVLCTVGGWATYKILLGSKRENTNG